jgi:hypothetical protein
MIGLEIHCAREGCNTLFKKVTHNQKYCGTECQKFETNRKVMENYHRNAAIRRGEKRYCITCGNRLSRYNTLAVCSACEQKGKALGTASELMASVTWL